MRIYFDTEFYENGNTIELISIGMVREDGQMFYREVHQDVLSTACREEPWLVENVFPTSMVPGPASCATSWDS